MISWISRSDDVPAKTYKGDNVEHTGRSVLVRARWSVLGIFMLVTVAGVTLLSVATDVLFGSSVGDLISFALAYVGVVMLGQPSDVRRKRGIVYWLLTAVLVGAALLFYTSTTQIVDAILTVGVAFSPEFLMNTGVFIALSNVLFFTLPFLFFLWWAGCFNPSRLLRQYGWLKLLSLLLVCVVVMWVLGSVNAGLPYLPYYLELAIVVLLMGVALFLCWFLLLGTRCLFLEDGVGFLYVRPKKLGVTAWVIAALVAGAGVVLVVTIPSLSTTAWSDNLSLMSAIGNSAGGLYLEGSLVEKDQFLASIGDKHLSYVLSAFARSGVGMLILLSIGVAVWLILLLKNRSIPGSSKVMSLLLVFFAATLCLLVCIGADIIVYKRFSDPMFLGVPRAQLHEIVDIIVIPLAFAAMAVVASYVSLLQKSSLTQSTTSSVNTDGANTSDVSNEEDIE